MQMSDLTPAVLAHIAALRYDRILEKHEGPWRWAQLMPNVEFMTIGGGFEVLLPIHRSHHPQITIKRVIPSADGNTLTIFLKDTTYVSSHESAPYLAGFMAVCDRLEGDAFFVAILYHEWFILDDWDQFAAG